MADNDLKNSSELDYEVPFDDADGDLILHSSDGKHFRVFKVILRKASTFFADMFMLPPPPNHNPETPQDVAMSEDGETLDRLLRMCYPMEEPDFTGLGLTEIKALLIAADKFGMQVVAQRSAKLLQEHAPAFPLSVYAIALSAKLDAVALVAAQECLRRPQSYMISTHIPEIDLLTAAAYQSLLHYYGSCTSVATALVTGYLFPWIPDSNRVWFNSCTCPRDGYMVTIANGESRSVPLWWRQYMNEAAEELKRNGPLALSTHRVLLKTAVPRCNCFTNVGINDIMAFTKLLQATIEHAVLEIKLIEL